VKLLHVLEKFRVSLKLSFSTQSISHTQSPRVRDAVLPKNEDSAFLLQIIDQIITFDQGYLSLMHYFIVIC